MLAKDTYGTEVDYLPGGGALDDDTVTNIVTINEAIKRGHEAGVPRCGINEAVALDNLCRELVGLTERVAYLEARVVEG